MSKKNLRIAWVAASGLFILSIFLMFASVEWSKQNHADVDIVAFTNPRHTDQATIPFTLSGQGMIQFYGTIEGRRVPIVLDTGADFTTLPSNWKITGKPIGEDFTFPDGGNNSIKAKPILVPLIQLQGCNIINAVAVQLSMPGMENVKHIVHARDEIHLGNYALWNSVLTIDYQNQILTISKPSPSSTSQRATSDKNEVMRFSWNVVDSKKNYSAPILYGMISGRRIMAILDSGTGNFIALDPQLFSILCKDKQHPTCAAQTTIDFMGGRETEKLLPSVSMVIDRHTSKNSSFTLQGRGVEVNKINGNASVIIGASMFENFLITIDYPQHTIVLSYRS